LVELLVALLVELQLPALAVLGMEEVFPVSVVMARVEVGMTGRIVPLVAVWVVEFRVWVGNFGRFPVWAGNELV